MQIMEISKLLCAIHQVMLLRQDPIHEFTLCTYEVGLFSKIVYPLCETDQIILHLSTNHIVKKLALVFDASRICSYNLPFSVFSLYHLAELYLSWCGFDHQLVFNGFGSFTILSLDFIRIFRKTLLHLLSNSPSLMSDGLFMLEEQVVGHEKSTMIELFECLPLIEHLAASGDNSGFKWFVQDLVPQELSISLIHLKYFRFEQMSFHDSYGLTFLVVSIKNSLNLEKNRVRD
ncbi:hypothetical protein Hdeb2414_s0089g00786721 [Helianthus debilis subsp. tardiflorus]